MARPTEQEVPRFPRTINLETISTCNAKCVFCPHPLLNKNADLQLMSDGLFRKIIDECAEYEETREICFALQNEPLMDRDLFRRIRYVRQTMGDRPLVVVITNGSLLSPGRIEEMLKDPPDILKISFQGTDKETYEREMVGLRFERTMQNLNLLARRLGQDPGPAVMVSSVATDPVAEAGYEPVRRFWAEKGFDFTLINPENRAGTLTEQMRHLSSKQWRVRSWCSRPQKQMNILPTGNVVLCCADWRGEVIAGNAAWQTLHEIWHGEVLNRYRRQLQLGDVADLSPCNQCMQADIVMDGQAVRNFKPPAPSVVASDGAGSPIGASGGGE